MPDSRLEIRWLKRALASFDAEAAYIARDNPAAAARVVEAIATTVDMLAQHPALGRPGRVEGTRELVVPNTPYLVPYRVRGQTVEILEDWPLIRNTRALRTRFCRSVTLSLALRQHSGTEHKG